MRNQPEDRRKDPSIPHQRDVTPEEIACVLRAVLGLPPHEPSAEEVAASLGRPLPTLVGGLDTGAWIAWCMVGLPLFALGEPPTLQRAKTDAARVVMTLAMLRSGGNITRASRSLRTSRRVLRERLRMLDLYPWRRRGGSRETEVTASQCP